VKFEFDDLGYGAFAMQEFRQSLRQFRHIQPRLLTPTNYERRRSIRLRTLVQNMADKYSRDI
jgi:hypothetical protein